MSSNIRQITNFDLIGAEEEDKDGLRYLRITQEKFGGPVTKFGYCTNDNEGMNYPIYITINGREQKFQMGKTGMLEFNSGEEWQDVETEDEDAQKGITSVEITETWVHKGTPFCIDYVI